MARIAKVDHGMGAAEDIKKFAQEVLVPFGIEMVGGKPLVNPESEIYRIAQEVYQDMASTGQAGKSGVPQLTDMANEIQKRLEATHPELVETILTKFPYNTLEADKKESFLKAWDATPTSPYHVQYRLVAKEVQAHRKAVATEARKAKAAEAKAAEANQTDAGAQTEGNDKAVKNRKAKAAQTAEVAVS